ncbi:hypothetical protein IMZ48_36705 [Candidatus Bathyarchaeota archaeon]|nr:hypothetical protein [Candidatus Bathyarchaeota archaeon]
MAQGRPRPNGHTHLIEQGGVEFFASRGLLTELEDGDDILAAELVNNVHRLTIGGVSLKDEDMDEAPQGPVPGIAAEKGNKTGLDYVEDGDAPMDCTSD